MNKNNFKKINEMSKKELLETIRLIELIIKKETIELIENFSLEKKNYIEIEKELIENKINLIKSLNIKKYTQKESIENMTIYKYENNEINIYWNKKIELESLKKEINRHNKNIYIKKNNKSKKIELNDLEKIIKTQNNIILK